MRHSGGYGAPVAGRLSAAGLAPPAGICEQAVALRLYGFSAGAAGGSGFFSGQAPAGDQGLQPPASRPWGSAGPVRQRPVRAPLYGGISSVSAAAVKHIRLQMPFVRESGPGYFFAFRRYPLPGYRARLFLDMGFAFLMCRGLGRGEAAVYPVRGPGRCLWRSQRQRASPARPAGAAARRLQRPPPDYGATSVPTQKSAFRMRRFFDEVSISTFLFCSALCCGFCR